MKNKLNRLKSLGAVAMVSALTVASAAAQTTLTTTAATDAITDATAKGIVVVVAGFGIGALFLVARVVRRGMRVAG